LASYQSTSSFLYQMRSDSTTGFEFTALSNDQLSTGIYALDTLISKLSSFESSLYVYGYTPAQSMLGFLGFTLYLATTVTSNV